MPQPEMMYMGGNAKGKQKRKKMNYHINLKVDIEIYTRNTEIFKDVKD